MKQRCTFTLDEALIAKARQAVKAGAAPSRVSLVVWGLTRAIRRMELTRGKRFGVQECRLRAGRKTQRRTER